MATLVKTMIGVEQRSLLLLRLLLLGRRYKERVWLLLLELVEVLLALAGDSLRVQVLLLLMLIVLLRLMMVLR